ncbi:1-(5-phosphoribosyl)-5-[(5-phosphoribosylamino)methylideneamino]imidazole-4-carboxamide isomerase [Helicobacter mesocricetorum]|uniref:1-(5-phosphoribosyl)-5-[(5- phosphoribosylamino)methylideneamino]imidazole-4- carboxamide isomerase n=1 Tax=Helicobacter mesocricetorum TaxID=87012 RepID=UPI000CF1B333|nr:1-(5-phosphoribosyl)-5-[(5-phosphoribosylamino)methylideneamino]imidazole-4-carboxamide isomerase [Helicobacter mesocricetorum]
MQIIPAIDLKDGYAVRLKQGDMQSAKIYDKNPLNLCATFADLGAEYLHIVDLDGAIAGKPKNRVIIEQICKNSQLKIEVGGGIRNEETIKSYLDIGVSRLILGSIALQKVDFALAMAEKYPIVIGIDAKDGKVAINGWGDTQSVLAEEFAKEFLGSKIEAIVCTDISRDGMLGGININFTQAIARASGVFTIASGGLSSMEDLQILEENEIKAVIVGKAFYERKIDLQKAFEKFRVS